MKKRYFRRKEITKGAYLIVLKRVEDCREVWTVPKLWVRLGGEKYRENLSGSVGNEELDMSGGRLESELGS